MRNTLRLIAVGLAAWAVFMGSAVPAPQPQVLEVGNFSSAEAGGHFPAEWKPLNFANIDRHTAYSLVKEDERVVVKAVAEASASGLIREITIDPKEFPMIQWTWKVSGVLEKADVRTKGGDDYPARIYVAFAGESPGFFGRLKDKTIEVLYGRKPPFAALNYLWASKAPAGTMIPNPYTDRAMMFVLQRGGEKLGRWVREERNVFKDFERAFKEPPFMITGVAIMTDTDNTGESATAYYGDIVFKRQ
jgi:Protein of unknown function (DUF3047)